MNWYHWDCGQALKVIFFSLFRKWSARRTLPIGVGLWAPKGSTNAPCKTHSTVGFLPMSSLLLPSSLSSVLAETAWWDTHDIPLSSNKNLQPLKNTRKALRLRDILTSLTQVECHPFQFPSQIPSWSLHTTSSRKVGSTCAQSFYLPYYIFSWKSVHKECWKRSRTPSPPVLLLTSHEPMGSVDLRSHQRLSLY